MSEPLNVRAPQLMSEPSVKSVPYYASEPLGPEGANEWERAKTAEWATC